MTKKTRLFLIIAAGVLVVGLGTGLLASYMGLPALALGGSSGPDELKFVPSDARVIAYANVRDVMNSELRQKVRQLRPEGERHDELKEATGIDIENDIDEVVASFTNAPNDAENALVIARGRFDRVRIEGYLREKGAVPSEYHGARLLTHDVTHEDRSAGETGPGRKRGSQMAVAFVEPGLVAFGSAPAVRGAIDRKQGGQNITDNDEVMRIVRDIDDGNAWAVGRFDAIAQRAHLPREVENQIPAINWFAASGHVNGGVRGLIRAEARDEAAAQNLRDVVRGFVALAKLQTGGKPELNTLFESLQLGGEGKTVSLAFTLPSEVIDMLGTLAGQHRRGDRHDDPDPDDDKDHDVEPPAPPRPPAPPLPPAPPRPEF